MEEEELAWITNMVNKLERFGYRRGRLAKVSRILWLMKGKGTTSTEEWILFSTETLVTGEQYRHLQIPEVAITEDMEVVLREIAVEARLAGEELRIECSGGWG